MTKDVTSSSSRDVMALPSSSLPDERPGEESYPDSDDAWSTFAGDDEDVSALHDFIAGGVAGSASVVVGHPFDTIKVRLQTSTGPTSLLASATSYGGISSLFRGMAAPLVSAAAVNALIFSAYGSSSRLYDQYLVTPYKNNNDSSYNGDGKIDEDDDPWQKSFICGGFTGLVQAVVICPMEHIKCRLQIQHGKGSPDNLYKGPIDGGISILKSHGIAGLFRGWWCTCCREVPAFGLYFSTYDYVKDNVNNFLARRDGIMDEDAAVPVQHSHMWLASAFAGGISGCTTWAVVYPFDVIKTRIQTTPLDMPRSERTIMSVGRRIVEKHGWKFMFRGLGITLIRAFPVNGTIFPVYEFTLNQITSLGL